MKTLPAMARAGLVAERAGDFATGAFGNAHHRSYPIPMPGAEGLELAFLYSPWGVEESDGQRDLLAPLDLATFNAETAAFCKLTPFHAESLGLSIASEQPLGKYWTAQQRQHEQFASREARLYALYDELLAPFAAGIAPESDGVPQAAAEFGSLFALLAEAPLASCYQALGTKFFEWLRLAAAR
jgi:hypothetical protein